MHRVLYFITTGKSSSTLLLVVKTSDNPTQLHPDYTEGVEEVHISAA
jgi:hypothetical protein